MGSNLFSIEHKIFNHYALRYLSFLMLFVGIIYSIGLINATQISHSQVQKVPESTRIVN